MSTGTCPSGKVFYSCGNGFRGCCSIDPCNPGATCPDSDDDSSSSVSSTARSSTVTTSRASSTADPTTSESEDSSTPTATATSTPSTQSEATSTSQSTPSSQSTASSQSTTTSQSSDGTSTLTESSSSTISTSSTSTLPTLSATSCPEANNTMFDDDKGTSYQLICSAGTSGAGLSPSSVSSGGLQTCLSDCDEADDCVGVTFLGDTSGTCNLKSAMGAYIDCPADTQCTSALKMTMAKPGSKSSTTIGAIVGGVIGGVVLIGLLIGLIVFFRRRRRNATVQQDLDAYRRRWSDNSHTDTEPMRVKEGQSVFAPFGGFYRGVKDMYNSNANESTAPAVNRTRSTAAKTDYRVVNQTPGDDEPDPAQLDSRPISELADTSRASSAAAVPYQPRTYTASALSRTSGVDAPASHARQVSGGREGGRGEHAMSWNNELESSAKSPSSGGSGGSRPSTLSSAVAVAAVPGGNGNGHGGGGGGDRSPRVGSGFDKAPVSPIVSAHRRQS